MTSTAARNPSPVRSVDAGGVVGGGPHSRQRVESKEPRRCVRACACAYAACVCVRACLCMSVCVGLGSGERDQRARASLAMHFLSPCFFFHTYFLKITVGNACSLHARPTVSALKKNC